MEVGRLEEMVNGWFVGDFEPTLYRTGEVEVAVKRYAAGEREAAHHHKLATEITTIVSGEAEMQGRRLGAGDIAVLAPGESSAFEALTDVVLVAVKLPGAKDDKHLDA
jgi:quercetin dioxygenase-like cupin family protein